VLAWFRDRPDIRRLGQGAGISQATAYRYPRQDRATRPHCWRAAAGHDEMPRAGSRNSSHATGSAEACSSAATPSEDGQN
jgi:hypothetical protein